MNDHNRPSLFPIFLNLQDKLCTVVGGGEVAARKIRALLEAGAKVRVISPSLGLELMSMLGKGEIVHLARSYQPGDLMGTALAFAATDDREVNAQIYREGEEAGIPVNVVDDPEHCRFYVPSRIDRNPITIAISTQGTSPALARHLRERIEKAVPEYYQRLAWLLGALRSELMRFIPSSEERGRRWQRVIKSNVRSLLRQGRDKEAEQRARQLLGLPIEKQVTRVLKSVVIATRGSKLAMAQAEWVAAQLRELGVTVALRDIRTTGDKIPGSLLTAGEGAFVREIEQALYHGEADLAVHSYKDLPTGPRDGLIVAAVPLREDPRDALVTNSGADFMNLPANSRVATSSPRRAAQLRAFRPDLKFVPVRGNVDTRLQKLQRGDFDALVVACAGLGRLGTTDIPAQPIPLGICLPAPGQGALALQVRESDHVLRDLVQQLDHPSSRWAVIAERIFLATLGAGCSLPVGALGTVSGEQLTLNGVVADIDGRRVIRGQKIGLAKKAEELGRELAQELIAQGAGQLLRATDAE